MNQSWIILSLPLMYDFYFSTLYCEEREGVTRNEETEGLNVLLADGNNPSKPLRLTSFTLEGERKGFRVGCGPFPTKCNGVRATGQGGGSNQKHKNRQTGVEGASMTERRAGRGENTFHTVCVRAPCSPEHTHSERERGTRGPVPLIG